MLRILVAEDDPTTQILCAEMIRSLGHECFISPDGNHAYTAMLTDSNEFDLLITDVMMPGLDGRDLVRKLRDHHAYKKLPIIVMSAVIGPKQINTLLEAGATYFMPKPFEISVLEEYLGRVQ
jgi:CheY-like chemotaxis protein